MLKSAHRQLELTAGTKQGRRWAQIALACREVIVNSNPRVH